MSKVPSANRNGSTCNTYEEYRREIREEITYVDSPNVARRAWHQLKISRETGQADANRCRFQLMAHSLGPPNVRTFLFGEATPFSKPMHSDSVPGSNTLSLNLRYCLQTAAQLAPNGKILDFGCGTGLSVVHGLKRGMDIHGCEIFYAGGNRRERAEELGVLGTRVLEMPNGKIPHPDDTFDLVFHNQVFEHVPDIDYALAEITRVLKPGGVVLSLFPFRSVWREGHIGIPFAHRFASDSRIGELYVASVYRLGFGYHRVGTPREWARRQMQWLHDWCYYRSRNSIEQAYERAGLDCEYCEEDYVRFRLEATRKRYGSVLNAILRVAPSTGRFAFRQLGGAIFLSRARPT